MTHKHTAIYIKTILKKIIQDSIIYSKHITKEEQQQDRIKETKRKQYYFNKKTTIFYDSNFGEFWNRTGKESFWLFKWELNFKF